MNEQLIIDLKQLLHTLENTKKVLLPYGTTTNMVYERSKLNSDHSKINTEQTNLVKKQNIKHIFETFTLKANHEPDNGHSLELTALSGAFSPQSIQMIVRNAKTKEDSFIEICNVTVMGDPQLINFNGKTNKSQRGTSLVFKEQQDFIDWAVFGSSVGQGLSFDFANPHSFDVEVTIILVGIDASVGMVGQR
jgi:hypothetical protein